MAAGVARRAGTTVAWLLVLFGCGSSVPEPEAASPLARFDLQVADVAAVEVRRGVDSGEDLSLQVTLTPDASRRLEAFTAAHVGERVAIFVDDVKVMEPELREAIADGHLEITGPSEDELRDIGERLSGD